ncbi:MAG: DUF5916 domain-containing protein, partial [Chitinophagales bacterium]
MKTNLNTILRLSTYYFGITYLSFFMSLSIMAQDTATAENAVPTEKKQLEALRIDESIKIDGILTEGAWKNAQIADGFTQREPNPGADAMQKSQVQLLYDDNALYVGAILYDTAVDSILKQLSERDNIGLTDYFGITISPYQDGINGVGILTTPSNIQIDVKYLANGEDGAWDAVWESATKITDEGWQVELRIPYAVLRFPEKENQVWDVNFVRMLRRFREQSWWNPYNPKVAGFFTQAGEVVGIKDIKPPVRLQLFPYVSGNAEHFPYNSDGSSNWSRGFNAGLDLKYGISDAFTLDMTLVPDFGQVQSDNQVLNLTPFEVRFNENRQFFTEGTDLFNKAGLFYSRRIGGRPLNYFNVTSQLDGSELIVDNPAATQLINSTKISGRTDKGTGIGFFNSVTAPTFATVEKSGSGERREIETNPLTNYNVFVVDQNLKNNSYISLVNTNVTRRGETYDANVTGTEFDLKNKANSYGVSGNAAVSQKYYTDSTSIGHTYSLEVGKINGNLQYGLFHGVESEDYDPNDLGFLYNSNERYTGSYMSYNIFEPFGKFNRAGTSLSIVQSRLFEPNNFTDFEIEIDQFLVTRNFLGMGLSAEISPVESYDYFEPRTAGRFLTFPSSVEVGGFISSDYRKKLALDANFSYEKYSEAGWYDLGVRLSPRLRLSDRLMFIGSFNYQWQPNDVGFVTKFSDDEIILGVRDRKTIEHILNVDYIFNSDAWLTFRL